MVENSSDRHPALETSASSTLNFRVGGVQSRPHVYAWRRHATRSFSRDNALGANHSPAQWLDKMRHRGWTDDQIEEALQYGQKLDATNNINPAHGANRYIHPTTGRSLVIDDVTGEVIHVGGDGFVY